jgi:hypothetical protein
MNWVDLALLLVVLLAVGAGGAAVLFSELLIL